MKTTFQMKLRNHHHYINKYFKMQTTFKRVLLTVLRICRYIFKYDVCEVVEKCIVIT